MRCGGIEEITRKNKEVEGKRKEKENPEKIIKEIERKLIDLIKNIKEIRIQGEKNNKTIKSLEKKITELTIRLDSLSKGEEF